MDTQEKITETLANLKKLLLEKNKRYGDATQKPIHIFSKVSGEEGIKIRLDDKLKRINNSKELRKNDVTDLIGYLILLCISNCWTNFDELID